mgnify:CR=1 FL=1
MKLKFKKIAICASQKNKQIDEIAKQCCEVLKSLDTSVYLNENLSSVVGSTQGKCVSDKTLRNADLIVVIGGDGSILGFARRFGSLGVPLLGINLGNLGFLADIAPENITSVLTDIVYGKFKRDKRFFLEASINSKKESYIALNEIVIHSGAVAQLIEYEVYIDEAFVYRQRADGLIINSPTGSTAYSLSGGGPIIHPEVKAITLLPMFPHSLSTSPLVVKDTSNIKIIMQGSKNKATLSMDSHDSLTLKKGDEVLIQKTSFNLTLIHPKEHNFFSACRNKLGWSSAIT